MAVAAPIVQNPTTGQGPPPPPVLAYKYEDSPTEVIVDTEIVDTILERDGTNAYAKFKFPDGYLVFDSDSMVDLSITPHGGTEGQFVELERKGGIRSLITSVELLCGTSQACLLKPANVILVDELRRGDYSEFKYFKQYVSGVDGGYSIDPFTGLPQFDAAHVTHEQYCRYDIEGYHFTLQLSELLPLFRADELRQFCQKAFESVGVILTLRFTNNIRDIFPYSQKVYASNSALNTAYPEPSASFPVTGSPSLTTSSTQPPTSYTVAAKLIVNAMQFSMPITQKILAMYERGFRFPYLHYVYDVRDQDAAAADDIINNQLGFQNRAMERIHTIRVPTAITTFSGGGQGISPMANLASDNPLLRVRLADQFVHQDYISSNKTIRRLTEGTMKDTAIALEGQWDRTPNASTSGKWDDDEMGTSFAEWVDLTGLNDTFTSTGLATVNYEARAGKFRTTNRAIRTHFFGECTQVMNVRSGVMQATH